MIVHSGNNGCHDKYELRPSAQFVLDRFNLRPLIMAEIGVREGQNAIAMLKFMHTEMLYLVDSYEEYLSNEQDNSTKEEQDIWYRNMFFYVAPYLNNITLVSKPSSFASLLFPDGFFDYVYIDANHREESVYEDIGLWFPKVSEVGVLGGHDIDDPLFPGVRLAVERFCSDNKLTFVALKNDWIITK